MTEQAAPALMEAPDHGYPRNVTPSFMTAETLFPIAPLTRQTPITIAVDPVNLVVTECITVTSAMRKHARWAHSSVAAILGGGSKYWTPTIDTAGLVKGYGQNAANNGVNNAGSDVDSDTGSSRWGISRNKTKGRIQDNPLVSAFTKLRSDLKGCKGKYRDLFGKTLIVADVKTFDTPALLHPFLQVIRSSSTSASITSLALIAVTKFLSYNVISRDSPRLPEAMQLLSLAITHCRFEASHTPADEVVYIRILKLMEGMISGPGGELLSDESVCHIMETGLGLCCESRFTQILQRSAEITMVAMCQVVFERLKHLEFEAGDEPLKLDEETKEDMDAVKMEPTVNGSMEVEGEPENSDEASEKQPLVEGLKEGANSKEVPPSEEPLPTSVDLGRTSAPEEQPIIKPYSLPSIKELFRSLVELLDPHDGHYTDAMRVMALRIVDVSLEVAGPSIANHPSLASLAQDTLCRHLFQLVRSENMAILNESLRVAGTLLTTCRSVLKLQQELYISYLVACLYPRVEIPLEPGIDPKLYEGIPVAPSLVKPQPNQPAISSGRSTPVPVKDRQKLGLEGGARKPDAREAMVESIGAMLRLPTFMTELFVNYDCDVDRSDVCADMVGLISRNAFPDAAAWSTTNVPPLCLDALLGFVQSIHDRLDDEPQTEGFPDAKALRKQRLLKQVIVKGSAKFNENAKGGLANLKSNGVIHSLEDPVEVAKFLKGTSRIDKKALGDFISKSTNEAILKAFINEFDFDGLRVDEALRQLLYTFRLPGESQLIERIINVFCEKYQSSGNHDGIANNDAIFVLTYAIIMLNTDLHNPNLKSAKRMTIEDFARNLRGVNDGKDFELDYLKQIYETIKNDEIILPEEHANKQAYDHAWKEMLVKIRDTSDLIICNTNIFDSDMFAATWKPIVATLSYVFMSATDDVVFSRVITGFDHCARIAAKFGVSEAIDQVVYCLGSISTLAAGSTPDTSLNTEVQANERSVMVSEMAVKFGRDDRAQLATIVLFRVLTDHEAAVKSGWDHIFRIMLGLFVNSLVSASFSSIKNSISLGPIPVQPPVQVIDRAKAQNEGGLFSALSSYVSSFANDEPPEPSEQEIEYTLCTIDCVRTCAFDDLLKRTSNLPVASLVRVVESLLGHIPEDSSPRILVVKSDVPTVPRSASTYDPALVYVLELATILAMRDRHTVEAVGKEVATALQNIIRNASSYHYVVISRAAYYLFSLLRVSDEFDFVRVPVILHAFSKFDQELLKKSTVPLLQGLYDCISSSASLRSEMATSPDFWNILHTLHTMPEAAPFVFKILEDLASPPHLSITVDNYEPAIALLNSFASLAAVGANDEQRRDLVARRNAAAAAGNGPAKQAKAPKPKHRDEVQRGSKSVTLVFQLTSRVPSFIEASHLETTAAAWNTYWSPIFRVLARQCLNPCREIRHPALSALQRALLSKDLASTEHKGWTAIFGEVLFPLINQLLKPEVFQSDPIGMGETRIQAATGLCKIFLHYLVVLADWDGMVELWVRILDIMERLMNSGVGENLVSQPNDRVYH
jgi:brefeldin A-resistance guanine nucleotide exchange factor 1